MEKNPTERFAREMLLSWMMNWEGQRIYREACEEANKDTSAHDEAPWQYRMDIGNRMQDNADAMTVDVERRARAAGVDVTDMLNLVDQIKARP